MAAKDSSRGGLASLGLQNRLLEVAVVVGMDEETGLQVRRNNDIEVSQDLSIFDYHFQGHLLDILSGPQDTSTSGSAEAITSSWKTTLKQIGLKRNSNQLGSVKPKPLQRGVSVRRLRKKANKHEEVPVSTDFLSNMPMLCLPEDSSVYESKPEPKIHCTVLTDIDGYRHYAAILTFYRKYYATKKGPKTWSLQAEPAMKAQDITNNSNNNGPLMCYVPWCVCFVSMKPYFSVMKDALSCFHREFVVSRATAVRKILEKYVTNLSLVVCPPSSVTMRFSLGTLPIILSPPPYPSKQENILDIDLRLPLFIFMRQPNVLMDVLACIMHEQRVVFFSSNYTLLPLVMECFRFYIRPMEWHHQYIPILFSEIIGFVDCPGIFMMGCHSRHKAVIEKIENDLFLVDLDHGTIITNSHASMETDGGRLGQFALHMPEFAVQNLLNRLSDFELYNSVTSVCQINPVTLEEIQGHNLNIRQNINRKIQTVFMEFMVDLFGSTLCYLDHERQLFKSDKFLESINPTDSPFYIKVSKSYMFLRFIKQRLARTTDDFNMVAEKRVQRRNSAKSPRSRVRSFEPVSHSDLSMIGDNEKPPAGDHRFSRELSSIQIRSAMQNGENELLSNDNLASDYFSDAIDGQSFGKMGFFNGVNSMENESEITIQLPSFPVQGTNFDAKFFYRRCITIATESIEKLSADSKSSSRCASHRAALLLVRGLYRLAEGKLVEGLQDLHATAKEDARFFPEKIIKKVVLSLNQHELTLIEKHSLYKSFPPRTKSKAFRTQSTVTYHMRSFFTDDDTAMYSLKKEPFTFVLEKNDITSDEKVITTLFEALCEGSDGETDEIEPECFNAFYQVWQQLKNDCEKAKKSLSADVRLPPDTSSRRMSNLSGDDRFSSPMSSFHSDERVIKVSATVQSNKGNGRLVLTTRRVIFSGAGSQECKSLIKLEEIITLKEGKLKNFLSSSIALFVIHQNSNSPLKIGLKNESSLWMHLINEIRIGRTTSRDQRDDNLSIDIAAHNVVLADAFYSAVTDEGFLKPDDALEWVAKLCKFESLNKSGEVTSFSADTEKMMLMCIDPSPKESKKAGVCGITYSSAGINETPRIWLTLSSGKLRLIDTTTWILDPKPIKDWDTNPNCVNFVQDKELWIGGDDGNIYILPVATAKVARILHDHSSPVVAIINAKEDLVASAARSGEVIIWVAQPTTIKGKFMAFPDPLNLVGFTPFKDHLCCCSTIYVIICDYEGNRLHRFELGDSPRATNSNLTCCTWEENDEVWAGDDHGGICVWDVPTNQSVRSSSFSALSKAKELKITLPKLSGNIFDRVSITCVAKHDGLLWVGNLSGEIVIFNTMEARQESKLEAHDGPVTSLYPLENRYMVSGSGGDDGKIVLWKQSHN